MHVFKLIGYSFGIAVAASLIVLLVGGVLFGLQFAHWAELEGRIVGVVATIAGAVGAGLGLWLALRTQESAIKAP
jgi:hypothetical protein